MEKMEAGEVIFDLVTISIMGGNFGVELAADIRDTPNNAWQE